MADSSIPLGEFPLATSEEEIDRAYQDDKALRIQYSGHDVNDNHFVTVVFALHAGLPYYQGHSIEPGGYGIRVFKQADDSLWVEVTLRQAK